MQSEPKEVRSPEVKVISAAIFIRTGIFVIRDSRILAAIFLFGLLFHPVAASAQFKTGPEVGFKNSVLEKSVPADWTRQAHKDKAEIQPVKDNGTRVLYMRSVRSAFTLLLDMALTIREFSFLHWAWKAWFLPLRSDIAETAADDRVLMVYSL